MNPFEMVKEFHAKVGQADALSPDITDYRINNLRLRLITEERGELLTALAAEDVIGVADALADLLYVVIGSAFLIAALIFTVDVALQTLFRAIGVLHA